MKPTGIRDLKANLSRYLREVKKGEDVVVSDRGRPVARIVPFGAVEGGRELRSLLLRLSKENRIILPPAFKPPLRPAFRKRVKGKPFSDAVLEGRR